MIEHIFEGYNWLPYLFAFLMGLAMLIYALLDGYDLGVGILTDNAESDQKDLMIASIGPFWDANETWLVLGVGILLVAFPGAQGIILGKLYIPVFIMILGLIFRGVAFDFRAKVPYQKKWRWNLAFYWGSLITALAQGYMLGSYIMGFKYTWIAIVFSILTSLAVASGYCLIGACWLIMKTSDQLQLRAVKWAQYHLVNTVIGIVLVSIVTPLASERIYHKWFSMPDFFYLLPIPILTGTLIFWLYLLLRKMPLENDRKSWLPLILTGLIYVTCFSGLAYSFFPYIVPGQLHIVDAASAPEALIVILVGTLFVLPLILLYTIFSYWIFRGKTHGLSYD